MSRARRLCTTAREPLLPRWGSFGKTPEQIATLEAALREDGEKLAALQLHFAELGVKLIGMVKRPYQWFSDPEWRAGWLESSREPRQRYSRINDALLDGCEVAYEAITKEFCSTSPDFQLYVESGALQPEVAQFLSEAAEKYRVAGRQPLIETVRVNPQVLLFTATGDHFFATVAFRCREAHTIGRVGSSDRVDGTAPVEAAATDESGGEHAAGGGVGGCGSDGDARLTMDAGGGASEVSGNATAAEVGANTKAGAAVAGEAAAGEAASSSAAAEEAGEEALEDLPEDGFHDYVQLWTFRAESPPIRSYVAWLSSTMSAGMTGAEGGGEEEAELEAAEAPVKWSLQASGEWIWIPSGCRVPLVPLALASICFSIKLL